jgi:hypothetical protein
MKSENTQSSANNVQPLHRVFEDRGGELVSDGAGNELLLALFKDQGINVSAIRTSSQLEQAVAFCCANADGATAFADRLAMFSLGKLGEKTDLNSRLKRDAISSWIERKPDTKQKMLKADRIIQSGLRPV